VVVHQQYFERFITIPDEMLHKNGIFEIGEAVAVPVIELQKQTIKDGTENFKQKPFDEVFLNKRVVGIFFPDDKKYAKQEGQIQRYQYNIDPVNYFFVHVFLIRLLQQPLKR
jgi:hypothetical protein